MERLKEFLETIVTPIVDNPNDIFIDTKTDELGVLLTLHVAKEDMGKVIGKQGETAKAIRLLLRIMGTRENARANLKIAEPENAN